ncbi:hypothetical protein J6590_013261 [Homalodisca vitripennis]|nr:hypothetical protein J6590_013261 [Homalodisca vitripennis]
MRVTGYEPGRDPEAESTKGGDTHIPISARSREHTLTNLPEDGCSRWLCVLVLDEKIMDTARPSAQMPEQRARRECHPYPGACLYLRIQFVT